MLLTIVKKYYRILRLLSGYKWHIENFIYTNIEKLYFKTRYKNANTLLKTSKTLSTHKFNLEEHTVYRIQSIYGNNKRAITLFRYKCFICKSNIDVHVSSIDIAYLFNYDHLNPVNFMEAKTCNQMIMKQACE